MEVMRGLVFDSDKVDWEDGSIYDASTGHTWNANVYLMPNGELRVRGYWHFQLIGRNIFFKKVS